MFRTETYEKYNKQGDMCGEEMSVMIQPQPDDDLELLDQIEAKRYGYNTQFAFVPTFMFNDDAKFKHIYLN